VAAACVHTSVSSQQRVTKAVAVTALLDYMEEVLLLVWGNEATSPSLALAFFDRCFVSIQ
jgi:hypothetical protein